MSEAAQQRAWHFYLDDMIGFCERVLTFTQATRNQLIHGYLGLDNDTLWSLVEGDIPALLQQLKIMKARYAV